MCPINAPRQFVIDDPNNCIMVFVRDTDGNTINRGLFYIPLFHYWLGWVAELNDYVFATCQTIKVMPTEGFHNSHWCIRYLKVQWTSTADAIPRNTSMEAPCWRSTLSLVEMHYQRGSEIQRRASCATHTCFKFLLFLLAFRSVLVTCHILMDMFIRNLRIADWSWLWWL